MPRKDVQQETETPAPAEQPPASPPSPEPTPAAGGRYRRLPDGSLEPIEED